ncbi:MAG: hypothetical protein ACRCUH_15200 [Shewanella sp.]
MNKAALINKNGEVIGEVFDAPETGNVITLAGCFTSKGEAYNCKKMLISRSKRNLAKAVFEQPVTKVGEYYTFYNVEDDEVKY